MSEYVFWAGIVSPHVAGLANCLADRGAKVTYVTSKLMSRERASQGWSIPTLQGVRLELIGETSVVRVLESLPREAIHITQGIRRNGYIASVIAELGRRKARWAVMMETVDDRGLQGVLKRVDYGLAFRSARPHLHFVLAIGHRTSQWILARGVEEDRIFPFAYFLEAPVVAAPSRQPGPYRIGFLGSLVPGKRVDLIVKALGHLMTHCFDLVLVGDGPVSSALRRQVAAAGLSDRVKWLGCVSMSEARAHVAHFDCLILPSEAEGWGAVVSEALMAGVPAICSDACGSVAAIRASGVGGVFKTGSVQSLTQAIHSMLDAGPLPAADRAALAQWATCLSSAEGAQYLESISRYIYEGGSRPGPPWLAPSPEPLPAKARARASI